MKIKISQNFISEPTWTEWMEFQTILALERYIKSNAIDGWGYFIEFRTSEDAIEFGFIESSAPGQWYQEHLGCYGLTAMISKSLAEV